MFTTRLSHPHSLPLAAALVLALIATSGCPSSTQTPTQTNVHAVDSNAPPAEQLTLHLENLASTLSSAKGNCDQVAAQLYGWTKGRQAEYPGLARNSADTPLEAAKHDQYKQRVNTALSTVLDVVGACKNHADAQAAFTEFDVLLDPPE